MRVKLLRSGQVDIDFAARAGFLASQRQVEHLPGKLHAFGRNRGLPIGLQRVVEGRFRFSHSAACGVGGLEDGAGQGVLRGAPARG